LNKHPGWQAGIIFILDRVTPDLTDYYMAPPGALERLVRPRAELFAAEPELDRQPRSLAFRRQLPREMLKFWKNAWPLLTGDVPDRAA
jgi:hypothetical protein